MNTKDLIGKEDSETVATIKNATECQGEFISSASAIKTKKIEPKAMPVTPSNKIGRNDSCPCGSGKKYKKCCMNKREYTPGG